jgi:hypothetical protein
MILKWFQSLQLLPVSPLFLHSFIISSSISISISSSSSSSSSNSALAQHVRNNGHGVRNTDDIMEVAFIIRKGKYLDMMGKYYIYLETFRGT